VERGVDGVHEEELWARAVDAGHEDLYLARPERSGDVVSPGEPVAA
jgi:hypothetical protein